MDAVIATAASTVRSTISANDNDQNIITLWLAQRPPTTTRSYRSALRYLQRAVPGVELRDMRLPHLQAFAQSLCVDGGVNPRKSGEH